jgi:hypothetical protein
VTAEALGQTDPSLVGKAVKTGDRLCHRLTSVIAVPLNVTSIVFWIVKSDPNSPLGIAFLGISLHACIDGQLQGTVWSLRALGRQNAILAATLVAAVLYGASLFIISGTWASWYLLFGYDLLLFLLLRRILRPFVPTEPLTRGMTSWEIVCPPATPHGDDTAADFSTQG